MNPGGLVNPLAVPLVQALQALRHSRTEALGRLDVMRAALQVLAEQTVKSTHSGGRTLAWSTRFARFSSVGGCVTRLPTCDEIFGRNPSSPVLGTQKPVGNRQTFDRLPGGGYVFALPDDGVRVELRQLRREHHQLHAEVDVRYEWAGAKRIACSDLNLSSQSARLSRAKYRAERARTKPDDFDWIGTIDDACVRTIDAERNGSNVIVLDDAAEIHERDHDVCGLKVPADAASMLIAHGDSLKSLLLLFVLGSLAHFGHRVLYLDYEWTAERHAARKRRLFGPDRLENLRYRRCHSPLTVEADAIRRYCDQHNIESIGVDSVGLACDGKLADDDTAIRFHRALGTLPPAVCAAHVPKSSLGPDGKGDAIGPFGSVFFSNLCRASWLIKKHGGATDDIVTIGCFPQKQNDGAREQARRARVHVQ